LPNCREVCKKRTASYIEGKIRTRTVGEGESRKYYTDIIGDQMTMLGAKRDDNGSSMRIESKPMESPMPVASEPADDLPF